MKIFTNNEFPGHRAVPTAAVVIAKDAEEAADILTAVLKARNLSPAKVEDMEEMAFVRGNFNILSDGDY